MNTNKKEQNVYLFFGNDDAEVPQQARALADRLCPLEEQTLGLEVIEGGVDNTAEAVAAINRCLEALRTVGFFGAQKIVWLKGVNFLADTLASKSADTNDALCLLVEELKKGIPPDVRLIITAVKVDKRSVFFKTCKARGEPREYHLPEKAYQLEKEIRERVQERLRALELRIKPQALDLFLDRCGTDWRQVTQELEKLAIYMGSASVIESEDVRWIISPVREGLVWDLTDAVGARDLGKSLRVLRQLLFQGESGVGIIIGLQRNIRLIMLLREFLDRGWVRVYQQGRWKTEVEWSSDPEMDATLSALDGDPRSMHPFRTAKLLQQAESLPLAVLKRWCNTILDVHEQIVSSSMPLGLLLEFLLLELLGGRAEEKVS